MTCQNEEASERGGELMEVDIADTSNGSTREIRENGLFLWPVLPQEYGEGLPYAPINFPSPGDVWGWRVGKRIAGSGFYMDRYLYLPERFQKSRRRRDGFASKLSAEQYVKARFPSVNVNAFFSLFSWKIPSKLAYQSKGEQLELVMTLTSTSIAGDKHLVGRLSHPLSVKDEPGSNCIPSEEMAEQSPFDSLSSTPVCKAGNRFCSSLLEENTSSSAAAQPCDVCCSESGFCRECCCILCCNTIDLALGGYSFIRCQATVVDGLICGHVAHINCALRSYMAGSVGGSVGLDTEYYCRRCDTRTDLTEHVTRLLKTCKSSESCDDIERILNVGACILRGSQKRGSQRLLNHIELALLKLKDGSSLEDVWKGEVDVVTAPTGESDHLNNSAVQTSKGTLPRELDHQAMEQEINQVLQELKRSQELEYKIAEERLRAQKDNLLSLYQLVKKEKSRLKRRTPPENREASRNSIAVKEESIRCELQKLKDMEKVAKGFGKTPKDILEEHFDLHES